MALRSKHHRPLTWKDGRRGSTPEYKYSSIKEILDNRCPRQQCNVYGVVHDLKVPTKSRGSDYFALIIIIDPSAKHPLKIRLFHRDLSYFPKVAYGDIVRIHRLKLYDNAGDLCLMSTKGWSWVLWRHSDIDNPVKKEESGSLSYTLLKSDEQIVDRLQRWQKQYADIASDWGFQKRVTISEIDHDDHCNVYCQVVDFVKEDSCLYVRIWDGSKPTIQFHQYSMKEPDEGVRPKVPDGYCVDVAVSMDHFADWNSLEITRGSFILFTGLHAYPNRSSHSEGNENRISELSLYEGRANGRGVVLAPQNEQLDRLESYITHARAIHGCVETQDTLDLLKQLDEQEKQLDEQEQDGPKSPKRLRLRKSDSHDSPDVTGDIGSENSDGTSTTNVPSTVASHSVTEISGEGMPRKISSIDTVLKKEVPLSQSKLFRVKFHMLSVNTPRDGWVGHYSPNTSMFFPSKNNGNHLKITDEVRRFIKSWRQVSGKENDSNSLQSDNTGSQVTSQWQIPSSDGNIVPTETERYFHEKDGSHWKSIRMGNFLVRKRKFEDDEFSTLYIIEPEDFSCDELVKYKSSYNRVVRLLPVGVLTSNAPPAVGIQDDVFYYCCPANASVPVIPSLKEEASSFQRYRISRVAGSPALVPRFDLTLSVRDDDGVIEKLSLCGKYASEFFWGITPQVYLARIDHYAEVFNIALDGFICNKDLMECIIEKKSRRHIRDLTKCAFSYEIKNTSLKSQSLNAT